MGGATWGFATESAAVLFTYIVYIIMVAYAPRAVLLLMMMLTSLYDMHAAAATTHHGLKRFNGRGPVSARAAPLYELTAERANSAQPVIATRLHMPAPVHGSHTAASTFFFNFNPTFLTLPVMHTHTDTDTDTDTDTHVGHSHVCTCTHTHTHTHSML